MAIETPAADVLEFWFGSGADYGKRHKRWFEKDAAFDEEIRRRFAAVVEELLAGEHRGWLGAPPTRNARNGARVPDPLALAAARHAVAQRYDAAMLAVERLFLYLPFEHSESLADQQRACELMAPLEQFAETGDALRYAEAHRAIIARFGRFPHRNAVLGRESTADEIEFLKQPGSAF